ncbi:hypothetical protein E8E11_004259 [Didymella keratinophila]|nr:hypothetical protein E8E11_004259 [Didymella keratinophila]
MVLKQPRTSCNNGLPIRRPSPARTLKNNRCFECQLGTPPNTHYATCLHQNDFTPTPNRFSILAGLNPSPETKWAFDFVPTTRSGTRRRGKRGGRQQRLKHVLKKKCEKPKGDGLDELCDRFADLHLDDNAPAAIPPAADHAPLSGVLSDVNAVRYHWAPQFRPSSLPTSHSTLAQPTGKHGTSLIAKYGANGIVVVDERRICLQTLPRGRTSIHAIFRINLYNITLSYSTAVATAACHVKLPVPKVISGTYISYADYNRAGFAKVA